jgi:hypothetical protein
LAGAKAETFGAGGGASAADRRLAPNKKQAAAKNAPNGDHTTTVRQTDDMEKLLLTNFLGEGKPGGRPSKGHY